MSLPTKFSPKSGFWKTEHAKTWWAESDQYGNIKKLYDPLELANISREAKFKIIYLRDTVDETSPNGKKTTSWAIDCNLRIREDVDQSIVLRYNDSDMRYYISDLKPIGNTFLAPFDESTEVIIVQKSVPYLIPTIDEAKRLMQNTGYKFGLVSTDLSGKPTEFYTTV